MKSNSVAVKLVVAALVVISSAPLAAQRQVVEQMQGIERPHGAPATIGAWSARMRSAIRPSVIAVEGTSESFVIPVAGNAAGANGTHFRSDVAFNNDRLVSQRIAVGWLAQGVNNCSSGLRYFNLPVNSVTQVEDFVGQNLGQSGLGAILVIAVTEAGAVDDDAQIDGYSRIWTRQPNSTGTVSQNFTAISLTDSIGSLEATLMGLKQSSQFRTNVGIVNFDETPHTWTFRAIATGAVTTVVAQPCSMSLTGASAGSASSAGNAAFTVKSDGFGFWWSGFGSSTDNITGDGWVARAIQ
jgi:hypothetical protein